MSLAWVPEFVETISVATLGDLYGWDVYPTSDPLRRVLHLQFSRDIRKSEVPDLRALLRGWAKANNCEYRKSDWEGRDFKALIILRGLGPRSEENPLVKEAEDARRRDR
jgi:hypothetical protein